jgi:hypothetical protein
MMDDDLENINLEDIDKPKNDEDLGLGGLSGLSSILGGDDDLL